jgi:AcrR family transcriptional regulator
LVTRIGPVAPRSRSRAITNDNKKSSTGGAATRRRSKTTAARVSRRRSGAEALEPRKQPNQDRSRETVAAILQAAAELIGDEGIARTTTNRIADRAGVSIGSLYQYFPNKKAILATLLERHRREAHAVIDLALTRLADPDVPFERGLAGVFHDLIELHDTDPKLMRALTADVALALGHDHAAHEEDEGYLQRTEAILRERSDVRIEDPGIAAQVIGQTIGALSRWLVHEAPPALDRRAFVRETVRMLSTYAGTEPPE